MRPEFVLGKPRYRPSLDHLTEPLYPQAPWPDLTDIGRRPSMAALWVRGQSGIKPGSCCGKPSGHMLDFPGDASAENQMPPMHFAGPCR
jgi:hypothetical protein